MSNILRTCLAFFLFLLNSITFVDAIGGGSLLQLTADEKISPSQSSGQLPEKNSPNRASTVKKAGRQLFTSGQAFIINGASGDQFNSAAVALSGKNVLVTWDERNDTYDIGGQLVAAPGSLLGNKFVVHNETADSQFTSTLSRLSNNHVIAAWYSYHPGLPDIFARIFDNSGTLVTGDIQVNTETSGFQINPSLAYIPGGGVLAVWSGSQTGSSDIYARIINYLGIPLNSDVRINAVTDGNQISPSVTCVSGNKAVVAWVLNASAKDIYIRGITTTSLSFLGSDVRVNAVQGSVSSYQSSPALSALSSGDVFVAWAGTQGGVTNIYGRKVDTSGNLISNEMIINSATTGTHAHIVLSPVQHGNILAVWAADLVGSLDNLDIYARGLDSSGTPLGSDLRLNAVTGGQQSNPAVSYSNTSGTFVTWSDSQSGNYDIYGQFLDTATLNTLFPSTATTAPATTTAAPGATTTVPGSTASSPPGTTSTQDQQTTPSPSVSSSSHRVNPPFWTKPFSWGLKGGQYLWGKFLEGQDAMFDALARRIKAHCDSVVDACPSYFESSGRDFSQIVSRDSQCGNLASTFERSFALAHQSRALLEPSYQAHNLLLGR